MPITAKTILNLLLQPEGINLEMKACKDSVPRSVWETYSAFANTRGGIILLGVTEHKELQGKDRFEITGVFDANKVVTDFFNIINNRQKVNRSVVLDSNVRIVNVEDKEVIYINIPEADYRQKPIYINNDLQSGTFKRIHEGDRHVTDEELAILIRDSSDIADSQVLEGYGMSDLDSDTLAMYRQAFGTLNPEHPYKFLPDKEFLIKLGGFGRDRKREIEGITVAGLLMFGKSQSIHEVFTNFRVDYLNLIDITPGESNKWNDRLTEDGRWEDNIYNFLILTLQKLLFTLPSRGKLQGVIRTDGGPMHEGIREAIVNAITYTDYRLGGVLRIDRRSDGIIMRNPGTLRLPPERIYQGDFTQARNSTIQKMLRMVGFGDNIGSGFQKIMNAWKVSGLHQPTIDQNDDVHEVWLTLPLNPSNVSILAKDFTESNNLSAHLSAHLSAQQMAILELIYNHPDITMPEIAKKLGMKESSVRSQRRSMSKLLDIKRVGSRKTGRWEIHIK